MLWLAVLGCGRIGRMHAANIAHHPDTMFVSEAPFGGVKFSGMGREGGPEGIASFLDTKLARIAI